MVSAAALRGQKRTGSYSAARGAQLAYMQSVALELAPQGIQFNAIAQNFVANPTYQHEASLETETERENSFHLCFMQKLNSLAFIYEPIYMNKTSNEIPLREKL